MVLWNLCIGVRKRMEHSLIDTEGYSELEQQQLEAHLVRKNGYVKQKRKDVLTVNVDGEIVDFSLDNVEVIFAPAKFDRVTLTCEIVDDTISEVRRIEPTTQRKIAGRVTLLEQGNFGVIDNKCIFFWNVLSDDGIQLHQNDRVTAECVECEVAGNDVYGLRCLNVTLIDTKSDNVCNTRPESSYTKFTTNKNGIEITEIVAVEFDDINQTKDVTMTVKNASIVDFKVLESRFKGTRCNSSLKLVSPTRHSNFWLKPGETKIYKFKATARDFGRADDEQFVITFYGDTTGRFEITRFIKVCVHDKQGVHNTIGTGRNVLTNYNYTREVMDGDIDIVKGSAGIRAPNFVAVKLDDWKVPKELRDTVLRSISSRCFIFDALDKEYSHLNETLSMKNYGEVFHDLLFLEELEMVHSIRKYDRKTHFTREMTDEREFLGMAVENVAETRPSLVIGDYVIAINPQKIGFKGEIHEVRQNKILLHFDEGFRTHYNNEEYDVQFYFSRRSLQKQHHAVELATKMSMQSILFPDAVEMFQEQVDVQLNTNGGELQCGNSILPWFNQSLNIIQKEAVAHILRGVSRPIPYVIFGPPGTGKTVTVIETVLQIVKNIPRSRILVATPSNSSANLITERIVQSGKLKETEFMRLASYNKVNKNAIPENIIRHCGTISTARDGTTNDYKVEKSGLQKKCGTTRLKSFRLLIGTCSTLGTLMESDFTDNHFTHVIIDEAGQCLETQLLMSLTLVEKSVGQVILAGDPKQLGPIVLSNFARKRGLNQSFLERLLDRSPYKPDLEKFEKRYDPRLMTRLVYNYRSVPSVIKVYNDLFYDNELKAMNNDVNSNDAELLRKLARILPNRGDRNVDDGVIFIGVNGKNETSPDSPSWHNHEEAKKVIEFLGKLELLKISAEEIGIITPYKQQVKTIRTKLRQERLNEPKIGTVEEFQGQERKIILLSTVRTTERHTIQDERYSLGFLKQPARMNVAISRARALLVIFGSPGLLSCDERWKRLLDHCKYNKSAVNCDYVDRNE